ncbi:MAG: GGDEF domain-containing protein [Bullifex sp.]
MVLSTVVNADGTEMFSSVTSSAVVYGDGISELVQTAYVPENTLLRLDTVLIQPSAGSFALYLDGKEIYSFPSDGSYLDLGSRTFFTVKAGNMRGKEIKLVTDTSGLRPIAGFRVYPIILTTDYGISSMLSSYLFPSLLFTGAGLVLTLTSIFIFLSVRKTGARNTVGAFLMLAVLNLLSSLSLYPVGLKIYNSPLFWNTLNNFINSAIIFFYVYFVMSVTDRQVMKRKTSYALSLGCILLFSLHTVLSMLGARASFYAGRFLMAFRLIALIIILIGTVSYWYGTRRNGYIVISTVMFLCSVVINTVLSVFPAPSLWQAIAVSVLRLSSVLIIVFRNASMYVSEQMNLISENELEHMAVRDSLSGCFTRREFEELISSPQRFKGMSVYIIFIDINGLKRINDCFGHQEGDKLIKYCGSTLTSFFGSSSGAFRIGGDEFCCIVPSDGTIQLSLLIRNLKETFYASAPYSATLSAGGIGAVVTDEAGLRAAVAKADELMYRDKRGISGEVSPILRARMVSDAF